jgi:3-isopropylmalate dehydrogenase
MQLKEPFKLLICPGDGIGPEITAQAKKLLPTIAGYYDGKFEWEEALIGASAIKAHGTNVPDVTWDAVKRADALLTACVGDPAYDHLPTMDLPGAAMLKLRKGLDLYANLRPIKSFPELVDASPLKASIIGDGIDLLIIRELVGGLYFGEPRGREKLPGGGEKAYDCMLYTTPEIERIGKIAYEEAKIRRKFVLSVDKANVLSSSQLWRDTISGMAASYPDIRLDHRYVDAFSMQIIQTPGKFDVVVTENTFGDILSDLASVLVGSIGLLPSASLGDPTWKVNGAERRRPWLYEPVHGSAPDIAGQNKANPIAMILSLAMVFRSSLGDDAMARNIEKAVAMAIAKGYRTVDIYSGGSDIQVGTAEMGDKVGECFKEVVGK